MDTMPASHRVYVFRKEDKQAYVVHSSRVVKKTHTLEFVNFTDRSAHVVFKQAVVEPYEFYVPPYYPERRLVHLDAKGNPLPKPPTVSGEPNYHNYQVTLDGGQVAIGESDPGVIIEP